MVLESAGCYQGLLWLCRDNTSSLCSRSLPWICLFSWQVPRAYVNLVTMLSIANLRELYAMRNISCPRTLMRFADDLCYSCHCSSKKAATSSWEAFPEREKDLIFQTTKHLCACTYILISTQHL